MQSEGEKLLAEALAADPLPGWDLTPQYKFDAERRWTFDFAFPSQRLAVEVEGKRHKTHAGHRGDCEKFNQATLQGWRIIRFPSGDKKKAAEWAALIREVLVTPLPAAAPQ